jgi:hypothetical protein
MSDLEIFVYVPLRTVSTPNAPVLKGHRAGFAEAESGYKQVLTRFRRDRE